MSLDSKSCFRALVARDARFDGVFFVGVRSTGIYCRPICPAPRPAERNCVFFASAVAAEREAFRACFRCRPELAPASPSKPSDTLLEAATAEIIEAAVAGRSLEGVAPRFGLSPRHLRRLFERSLGARPVDLAQTTRLAMAKRLLQDSQLPMSEVAFGAGFRSIRRFNAVFSQRFGRSPSDVRRWGTPSQRALVDSANSASLRLRLDFRPPLDWDALLAFLALRAIPGVESVDAGVYRRAVLLDEAKGIVEVRRDKRRPALIATASATLVPHVGTLVLRLRRLFDLDAQPRLIDAHLRRDAKLRPQVRRHPGLRVPGAFDGFETAVRAILGQQITVAAATGLAGKLAKQFGAPVPDGALAAFPSAERVAQEGVDAIAALGMPRARATAVWKLARAVAGGLSLAPSVHRTETLRALEELPGFGPWTLQYVAMRCLAWPDAFPATDLGVLRALGASTGKRAEACAERWRPWRAYGVMHLWTGESL